LCKASKNADPAQTITVTENLTGKPRVAVASIAEESALIRAAEKVNPHSRTVYTMIAPVLHTLVCRKQRSLLSSKGSQQGGITLVTLNLLW
jgi:hypothetical protein